jgi:hypothetical protein
MNTCSEFEYRREILKWYIGPGAHVGLYKVLNDAKTYFGVDGVVGLDYKFANLPLNLSLDWQPAFEFSGGGYIYF